MKKRILSMLLSVLMILSLLPATVSAVDEISPNYNWYTSAGENATNYTISTVADLMGLAKITQNKVADTQDSSIPADDFDEKTVTLASDLDLSEVTWFTRDSAGNPTTDYRIWEFAGTFDGNEKTISNLKIDYVGTSSTTNKNNRAGLFYSIVVGGKVMDLTLDTVTAMVTDKVQMGILSCLLFGDAENCHVKNVTVTGSNAGGSGDDTDGTALAGLFCFVSTSDGTSTVTGCSVSDMSVTVTGNLKNSGGLAGQVREKSTFSGCSATDVTFNASSIYGVGGLVGATATAKASVSDHTKTFSSCNVSNITINSSENMNYVGGFSGISNKEAIYNACTAANIKIYSTSSSGIIEKVGGFTGETINGSTATNSFKSCSVTGLDIKLKGTGDKAYVGGFAGSFSNNTTVGGVDKACSVAGTIDTSELNGGYTGGFLGVLSTNPNVAITIENCNTDVAITAAGSAGGFVGGALRILNSGSAQITATFTDCIANGNVISNSGVAGGFVGTGDQGGEYLGGNYKNYTNCVANGNVTGQIAGGFWGEITAVDDTQRDSFIVITGCKATGDVTGTSKAAGFVGNITTGSNTHVTKVTIKSSEAAPVVVVGTPSTSDIASSFANVAAENDTNITLGSGAEANAIAVPEKANRTFDGWYTDLNDENTKLADGATPEVNTVYFAKWEEIPSAPATPALVDKGRSLSLDGKIHINVYVGIDIEGYDAAYIQENGGLLVWTARPDDSDANINSTAAENISGLTYGGTYGENNEKHQYWVQGGGIAAKEYADEYYMCAYLKLTDDSYIYTPVTEYSVQKYCQDMLSSNEDQKWKDLCTEMLQYGAAAQKAFGYNTDDLADAILNKEQE